jgi:MurNAc alpha-1-phosphate uridylyltransferase
MPLIACHLRGLAEAGFRQVVINVSHLGQQIEDYCRDGSRWGIDIVYSHETEPLETAGGIQRALPLLGDEPFVVVNGDVWIDYPFQQLLAWQLRPWEAARLVLVDNPPQHALGDFSLDGEGRVACRPDGVAGYTYAGLGVFSPAFFADVPAGKLALRPLLDAAIAAGRLGAEHYGGDWEDVGTPQRLADLDARIRASSSR